MNLKEKGTKNSQASAETNSTEFGRKGSVTAVESSDYLDQKERKVSQALVLISPSFIGTLALAISREVLHPFTPLAVSHEILDHCFGVSSSKSARDPS